MKAVVYERYGGVDRLRVAQVPTPVPRAGEVLVQVVATSVNLSDWEGLHGSPAYARFGGLTKPRRRILGSDIAGRIAAVGPDVTAWSVGDEVFGDNLQRMGGFAEYAIAPEEGVLARKPPELTFEQVSTIPQSGAIAHQAVARAQQPQADSGADPQADQPTPRMLLNGGGGGTGMFTIQLARDAGIHLTGVDNAAKLAFMRELGAERVIDYRTEDFTRTGTYDLVVDLVARRSVFAYRRALAPGGRFLVVGGTVRTLLRVLTLGALIGRLTGRRLGVMAVRQGPKHFAPVTDAAVAGTVSIVIDSVFPLDEVPQALAHHGEGRALGKVVIRVRDEG